MRKLGEHVKKFDEFTKYVKEMNEWMILSSKKTTQIFELNNIL